MATEKGTASAICRGQTIKYDTIFRFVEAMPKTPMKKELFNDELEKQIPGWKKTHYEPAKQAALYYEEDGVCYPRFEHDVTVKDVVEYIISWATKYFAPNPFTKDLKDAYTQTPINIYAYLCKGIMNGHTNFNEVCNTMFEGVDKLNNIDKIKAYIIAFTNINIDDKGNMSLRKGFSHEDLEVYPQISRDIPEKEFFHLFDNHVKTSKTNQQVDSTKFIPFIAAIKTKPFLLLSGISGTGKSQMVRKLAKACWTDDNKNKDALEPENFSIIPVRPNWHDSTELIGYVSNIPDPHYVVGPFLKAIIRAWELTGEYSYDKKTIPYFVCLDEMNLAPVEQYFAEYLSIIESRDNSQGDVATDALLNKDEPWFEKFCHDLKINNKLKERFLSQGISIPPNLIVCGTVNMDETTYAFSRKVLDRAMTIEMNEVELENGLKEGVEEAGLPLLSSELLLPDCISPEEYYNVGEHEGTISMVLDWLKTINNEVLEGTPFKIAYRSRNEIILYVIHSEELGISREKAFDEAVNMKILPRIEGDRNKVGNVLTGLKEKMKTIVGDGNTISSKKLEEMEEKMNKQYYCTYWS